MTATMITNRYSLDAEIAHRHAEIRKDFSPRRGSKRHVSLLSLPGLPTMRSHHPSLAA